MPLKVSYNNPAMMKGVEVELLGIGMVPNGGSATLTAEQEQEFIMLRRETVRDVFKDSEDVKVEGSPEFSGGVNKAFGTDLDKLEISDTVPVHEGAFDHSPATSVGESIYTEPEPALQGSGVHATIEKKEVNN